MIDPATNTLPTATAIVTRMRREKQYSLIGSLLPKRGHTLFKVNRRTWEVSEAEYQPVTYQITTWNEKTFQEKHHRRVILDGGHCYVSALNKANALKHFLNALSKRYRTRT